MTTWGQQSQRLGLSRVPSLWATVGWGERDTQGAQRLGEVGTP